MNEKLPKIEAKKSLGQHFLNNTHVPKLMADAADVKEGDIVLEIGPGTGVLTRELLNRGAQVIAIEADLRAIASLEKSCSAEIIAKKLVISHKDIRAVDLMTLGLRPRAYKIVANIPYYLSGFLFRFFLEHDIQPSHLVFLVQKEVASRIARDKKESLLSLSIKVFGKPHYVKTVGKGNFTPAPKIDSAIIAVSDISKESLSQIGFSQKETHEAQKFFFSMLHEGFKSKRKQLLGNLSDTITRDTLIEIFTSLGLSLAVRGEDLSIEEWLTLCRTIHLHK